MALGRANAIGVRVELSGRHFSTYRSTALSFPASIDVRLIAGFSSGWIPLMSGIPQRRMRRCEPTIRQVSGEEAERISGLKITGWV
jgi:hypothetical protein